ncbi:MAG: UvrD-helicase domain-containing protein [Bacteroidales bacterium]|jgi:uncharacterized protein (TIGR00375 family)|nr:UvrD-helicase domain-containing protein [Bacteroidales bacterium]
MKFIADLHIHSHFSMATSKKLTPEHLDYWAKIKGIKIVGTGDFTHPGWTSELKEKLEPAEPGLFKLKDEYKLRNPVQENKANAPRFLLSAEISNIYKKKGKVRKIHNVILAPTFDVVDKIQQKLGQMNFNITSDGRPILGLDAKDLLDLCLEVSEDIFFIPAHIWTPWFSALGSKSGFNSIEECFEDLSKHIYALETGLSTDPALNWMCGILDRYTLVSNSDAHSPEKLGRNANLFDTEVNYYSITEALKTGDERFAGTFDMFPQEGKYHYDGHRKCKLCWDPVETMKHHHICPVCGKKVTVGVVNRIVELSDRTNIEERPNRKPFYSIIPLPEILAEIEGMGEHSKKIKKQYEQLIAKANSEFNILHFFSTDKIKEIGGQVLAEAIQRMRNHQVIIKEGYDGEYGEIKVFRPDESKLFEEESALFEISALPEIPQRNLLNFDLKQYQQLILSSLPSDIAAEAGSSYQIRETGILQGLNPEQAKAVKHEDGASVIVAGPGTGKTNVLTKRIAYLIREKNINPGNILAVTFTNQAAKEMLGRTRQLLEQHPEKKEPHISTFHALGYSILKNYYREKNKNNIHIIDDNDKQFILQSLYPKKNKTELRHYSQQITNIKQKVIVHGEIEDETTRRMFEKYSAELQKNHLFDLDDLIYKPLLILNQDKQLLEKLQQQFQWILVDEYQDINEAQYRFIQTLTGHPSANINVIGDPNQAIYGFRGSSMKTINQFIEDFPHAKIYKLNLSYRCTNSILKASGNILKEDDFLQGLDDGVRVKISDQPTDKSEAEYIAREIEKLAGGLRFFSMDSKVSGGETDPEIESLSDFAILCRTKAQMPVIEKGLNDHSIPYQKINEDEFFNHKITRVLLALLKYSRDPQNTLLRKIITNRVKVNPFLFHKLTLQHQDSNPAKFIEFLWDEFIAEKTNENSIVFEKIKLLANQSEGVENLIQNLSLGQPADLYEPATEKVSLMTIHAAKGMEFKCVFIAGCENGLIPYSLFKEPTTDHDEEKRLLYVGMTRAKSKLYLTHAKKRFFHGREFKLPQSPFLNLIEKQLTERSKSNYKKPDKDHGQMTLFG